MSFNIKQIREELCNEVNIFAVARSDYGLDVDEDLDSVHDVIEMCVAVEYENQFN